MGRDKEIVAFASQASFVQAAAKTVLFALKVPIAPKGVANRFYALPGPTATQQECTMFHSAYNVILECFAISLV